MSYVNYISTKLEEIKINGRVGKTKKTCVIELL